VQTPNIEGTVCPIPQASAPAGKKKPGRTKRGAAGQGNKGGVYKPQVFAKPVTSRGDSPPFSKRVVEQPGRG
jgi:hypothetical protein